jgi:hypothetical protein
MPTIPESMSRCFEKYDKGFQGGRTKDKKYTYPYLLLVSDPPNPSAEAANFIQGVRSAEAFVVRDINQFINDGPIQAAVEAALKAKKKVVVHVDLHTIKIQWIFALARHCTLTHPDAFLKEANEDHPLETVIYDKCEGDRQPMLPKAARTAVGWTRSKTVA